MHRDFTSGPSHDAFWIFLLWRALHSGEATLADIAAAVIANLAQYLPAGEHSFGVDPLPASRDFLAVSEIEDFEATDTELPDTELFDEDPLDDDLNSSSTGPVAPFCSEQAEFSIYHNYFKFKGVYYRVQRPTFACLPTAA